MESVIRAAIAYVVLMLLFRVAGKRSLAEVTSFDLVLLLIISEATQQAMIDNDNSMTNALLLVSTLIGMNILLSVVTKRWKPLDRWIEDVPLVILRNGEPIRERMRKERIDELEILSAARLSHGLERMDQIRFAVLERTGGISIVPEDPQSA